MADSLEKNLWAWLKRGTKRARELDMERVENGVGEGTPDVDGCFEGGDFKIELKTGSYTIRHHYVRTKFRPKQLPWIKRRTKVGGRCFVLIQIERHRYLIPGSKCDIFTRTDLTLNELELASIVPIKSSAMDVIRACAHHPL